MKTTFEATLPNGERITRTTEHTYTHVVIWQYRDATGDRYETRWAGNLKLAQGEYNGRMTEKQGDWEARIAKKSYLARMEYEKVDVKRPGFGTRLWKNVAILEARPVSK
jgi:hypothetical protein